MPYRPIKFVARAFRVGEFPGNSSSSKDCFHVLFLKTACGEAFYELSCWWCHNTVKCLHLFLNIVGLYSWQRFVAFTIGRDFEELTISEETYSRLQQILDRSPLCYNHLFRDWNGSCHGPKLKCWLSRVTHHLWVGRASLLVDKLDTQRKVSGSCHG